MSEEQEQNSEEEEDQEEENEDEQQDDDEQKDQDDEDEQEDEDGSGDGDGDDQQQQEQDEEGESESKNQSKDEKEALPKFRSIEPQQFKFSNLLSEISSLSLNVDHFISSLPSHGGSTYYRSSYVPPVRMSPPQVPLILPRQQSRVVIMKDEDTQVSMQPQIVIQPTKIQKPPVEPSYKVSNESNKFLAQLYQENKKLKRWQNNSHTANSHQGASNLSNGFYGSRERFERQQYQKGLFNVDERNREIDEAIEKLKRQDRQ